MEIKFLCPILESEFGVNHIYFVESFEDNKIQQTLNEMKLGEICLFENVRFHPGEENNDLNFIKDLCKNFDVFINDAFSASHRSMPPKRFTRTALTELSDKTISRAFATFSSSAPPPISRKFAGSPPASFWWPWPTFLGLSASRNRSQPFSREPSAVIPNRPQIQETKEG